MQAKIAKAREGDASEGARLTDLRGDEGVRCCKAKDSSTTHAASPRFCSVGATRLRLSSSLTLAVSGCMNLRQAAPAVFREIERDACECVREEESSRLRQQRAAAAAETCVSGEKVCICKCKMRASLSLPLFLSLFPSDVMKFEMASCMLPPSSSSCRSCRSSLTPE